MPLKLTRADHSQGPRLDFSRLSPQLKDQLYRQLPQILKNQVRPQTAPTSIQINTVTDGGSGSALEWSFNNNNSEGNEDPLTNVFIDLPLDLELLLKESLSATSSERSGRKQVTFAPDTVNHERENKPKRISRVSLFPVTKYISYH